MIYYRVKPEYDNVRRYNGKKVTYDGIWIANELYTEKELNALHRKNIVILSKYFDRVEIKKSRVYWFFGARFECK